MDKPNPARTAALLTDQIGRALDELSFTANRRRDLEELHDRAASLAADLAHFDAEYASLDLSDQAGRLAEAYQQWEAYEPGTMRAGDSVLARLVSVSIPLSRLESTGITVKSIRKYSVDAVAFASVLGDNFEELSRLWSNLKRSTQGSASGTFKRSAYAPASKLVEAMERLGTHRLEGIDQVHFKGKERSYRPLSGGQVNRVPERSLLRARLTICSNDSMSIVTGEWLNAYVYSIIHDQLRRNAVEHEIYSAVEYTAPPDVIRVQGDFDVLVQAGDTVVAVECKSGMLKPDRGDFRDIVSKVQGLTRVFELTQADVSFVPILVFNPHATAPEIVAENLAGSGVEAITPAQVRGKVMSLVAQGQRG